MATKRRRPAKRPGKPKATSVSFWPLCYRCEHRAAYLEARKATGQGHAPRYECQQCEDATGGCYMFSPVRPLRLVPAPGERRPIGGPWMIAGRVRSVGVQESERVGGITQSGCIVLYARPL
jgi:hypothetical protein